MRKILTAIFVIGLVATIAGAGIYAYFSDTKTSTGNTFTAGTLDLKVGDWDEDFKDGVTATWTMSDMVPGVTTVGPYSVNLKNVGTVAANHVEISFSHSIDETTNPVESDTNPNSSPRDMARWIEITAMTYNGNDFKAIFNSNPSKYDSNGNGFFDLEDVTMPPWTDEGGPLDNLPPPLNSGGSRTFTMALKFNAGATNDIQGDILTTTITFTLNQHSSQ
jgi:predicted ribosomally synthesized peptide with SipW-like signal peptide